MFKAFAAALAAVALVAVVTAGSATAAKPKSPWNGKTIRQVDYDPYLDDIPGYSREDSYTATVQFDWRWGKGEYWGAPYMSRNPSTLKGTRHFNEANAGSISEWTKLSHVGGGGIVIGGPKNRGVWYWRICAVSRSGEDDVCKFSGRTYHFRIVGPKGS